MKLTFFGSSHHSAQFLEQATKNGLKIDLVVSRPPKPIGRKQILTENPTITVAKKLNLSFIEKLSDLPATMKQCNNETIGLILDYNKIIPLEIINLFPKGIINIHFSKLPQYRGPAPVQATILNGDKEAWISYFLIIEEVDAGPILKQTSTPLDFTETTESLYQKLIERAAVEITPLIKDYLSDKVEPCQQTNTNIFSSRLTNFVDKDHPCQQEGNPTFSAKLTTETAKIDWQKSPVEIDRLIRAACPEPGAWTSVQIRSQSAEIKSLLRLKVLRAHLEGSKLILDTVQLEGKKPVAGKQFLEAHQGCTFVA